MMRLPVVQRPVMWSDHFERVFLGSPSGVPQDFDLETLVLDPRFIMNDESRPDHVAPLYMTAPVSRVRSCVPSLIFWVVAICVVVGVSLLTHSLMIALALIAITMGLYVFIVWDRTEPSDDDERDLGALFQDSVYYRRRVADVFARYYDVLSRRHFMHNDESRALLDEVMACLDDVRGVESQVPLVEMSLWPVVESQVQVSDEVFAELYSVPSVEKQDFHDFFAR